MMMTSKIGTKEDLKAQCAGDRRGFTFIEVMVTLVVLSLGIVGTFRTFFFSLDRMQYLTDRLYASMILDNHMVAIERMLRAYKALPSDLEAWEGMDVGLRAKGYKQKMNIGQVEDFTNIFSLDISLNWMERGQEMQMSRSAYVSDPGFPY